MSIASYRKYYLYGDDGETDDNATSKMNLYFPYESCNNLDVFVLSVALIAYSKI